MTLAYEGRVDSRGIKSGNRYMCPVCFDHHEKLTGGRLPLSSQEEEWLNSFRDDVRVIDEYGREVWASKLAKRYRSEMMRQKASEFRRH